MNRAELAYEGLRLAYRNLSVGARLIDEVATTLRPLTSRVGVFSEAHAKSSAAAMPSLKQETLLSLNVNGTRLDAQFKKFHTLRDGESVAVLQLNEWNSLAPRKPVAALQQVSPGLWTDKTGAAFRTKPGFPADEIPEATDVTFASRVLVANREQLKVWQGTLPQLNPETLRASGQAIASSIHSRDTLIRSFNTAPAVNYSPDIVALGRPTVFNPAGGKDNCMTSTAAVLRSLESKRLVTAPDIERFRYLNSNLGSSAFGKFKNEREALSWFEDAAGAKILRSLTSIKDLVPGRPYALTLPVRSADYQHMVFAFQPKAGATTIYDAQGGIRITPQSVRNVPKSFWEMEMLANPRYNQITK